MALRSLLLLRIQGAVLPSTKGPRMGPLSALSPAATRFMRTKSQNKSHERKRKRLRARRKTSICRNKIPSVVPYLREITREYWIVMMALLCSALHGCISAPVPLLAGFLSDWIEPCEHSFPTTIAEAEQGMAKLRDSVKAMQQETIKDQQKLREQLTEFDKEIRLELAEVTKTVDKAKKAGNALAAAVLGTPLLLIFMSKYQSTAD